MKNMFLCEDFYKICHKKMYPENMTRLYSVWIPRSNGYFQESDRVVWFGLQGFIKNYLISQFNDFFFNRDIDEVVEEYKLYISKTFQENPDVDRIISLHKLGYLPIKIKALEEGSLVPYRIPCMTVENTHDDFAWLTNFLETLISCSLWIMTTTATTAYSFRKIIEIYTKLTSDNDMWPSIGCGDFSFRGMSSLESAITSGASFLTSFTKTSTIPAIKYLCDNYNADINTENIGSWSASVEHSCTASNYIVDGDEELFFKKMCTELYPSGNFSFVSDTYDYFNFINNVVRNNKQLILSRDGCIRIRPDSGNPIDIICGNKDSDDPLEQSGSLNILWDIFGGSINSKGYKVLDRHIGIVYGDAITLERCKQICQRMKEMGFAIENVIFGVGSYSLQYRTRDSQGWALKATYGVVDGKEILIYKNPKTDNGTKKSPRGKVAVHWVTDDDMVMIDMLSSKEEANIEDNLLQTVFENGILTKEYSLQEIRNRLHDRRF